MYTAIAMVAAVALYAWRRDAIEALLAGAVGIIVSVCFYYGALYAQASDVELLSGAVVEKKRTYDPETETYSCGTDSKGHTKTCTRTIPRWKWSVISNIDDDYSEHTYSKSNEPEIYKFTAIGDAYARSKLFLNFQYVSEQTVMLNKQDQYTGWLPEYPQIYNGFQVDRGLSRIVASDELSGKLAIAQRDWGPFRGANVIVCVVDAVKDVGFSDALRNKWTGGKKNDVVLTLYLTDNVVQKAEVFSRSTNTKRNEEMADFNMVLKQKAEKMGTYDVGELLGVIELSLPYFEREDLRQYDFLESDYSAPVWVEILGTFLLLACMGLTVKVYSEKFGRRRYGYSHRRRFT
jgi:hypothetical protein